MKCFGIRRVQQFFLSMILLIGILSTISIVYLSDSGNQRRPISAKYYRNSPGKDNETYIKKKTKAHTISQLPTEYDNLQQTLVDPDTTKAIITFADEESPSKLIKSKVTNSPAKPSQVKQDNVLLEEMGSKPRALPDQPVTQDLILNGIKSNKWLHKDSLKSRSKLERKVLQKKARNFTANPYLLIKQQDLIKSNKLLQKVSDNRRIILERKALQKNAEENFCRHFINDTYKTPINVCLVNVSKQSVQCFGNSYSNQMAACVLINVAINPPSLASMIHSVVKPDKNVTAPISLLHDMDTTCDKIDIRPMRNHAEQNSYIFSAVRSLKRNSIASNVCQVWIENDAYVFNSNQVHIYFRFLDYFNLHKLLEDYSTDSNQIKHIIRVSEARFKNYHFPEFDQALFPEAFAYTLKKFGNNTVCFKRIVVVPRSYGSYLFRCKMSNFLRQKCMECDGKKLNINQATSFRKRVLKACSLDDDDFGNQSGVHNILIISRKKYNRFPKDNPKKFQRILKNEQEVVIALQDLFPNATVKLVHLEEYGICQQVKLAHSSDLLVGVHGAGLVHLWWLRHNSLVYEIEPYSQIGNPTFSMLAKLTGHKYMHQIIENADGNHYMADITKMRRDLSILATKNT